MWRQRKGRWEKERNLLLLSSGGSEELGRGGDTPLLALESNQGGKGKGSISPKQHCPIEFPAVVEVVYSPKWL